MEHKIYHDTPQNILIVEDDPYMLYFVRISLEELFPKAEIIEISNGLDALEKLSGKPPDLMILDICLPGIDGLEILRNIQKSEIKRKLKVLAISGNADKLANISSLGADGALTKPFSTTKLQEEIKKILLPRT